MLVRTYQVVAALICLWFCIAAFQGWKSPRLSSGGSGGGGGGYFGGFGGGK